MIFKFISSILIKHKNILLVSFIILLFSFLSIRKLIESNNEKFLDIVARAYFDEKYYLTQYPEVAKLSISPFKHYSKFGWLEGKNPNANFDNNFYLRLYNSYDVSQNGLNPLQHYVSCKIKFNICYINKAQLKYVTLLKNPEHYLSIVTIFRNEARFLREWIEFYKLMGVEHFYLYNHLSTDNYMEVLQPYIDKGIVELEQVTEEPVNYPEWYAIQNSIYNKTVEKTKNNTEWLIVVDSDEFLFPIEENKLSTILKKYDNYASLSVNWRIFGSNNVKRIKKNKLLIESLIKAEAPNNLHVKTIIKPRYVKGFTNPHFPQLFSGYAQVTENFEYFYGPFSPTHSRKILAINHYSSRDSDFLNLTKINRVHFVNTHLTTKEKNDRINQILRIDELQSIYPDYSILKFVPELRSILFANSQK